MLDLLLNRAREAGFGALGREVLRVSGLSGGAKAALLAAGFREEARPTLFLAENAEAARFYYENLTAYLGEEQVVLFPRLAPLPFNYFDYSSEFMTARVEVLSRLVSGEKLLVVADGEGILRRLPAPSVFAAAHIHLDLGQDFPLNDLVREFSRGGYVREAMVSKRGEFAARGNIVDIFPASEMRPVRIEFFDTEIESIRYFDPDTQRSEGEELKKLVIAPASTILHDIEGLRSNLEELVAQIKQVEKSLSGEAKRNFREKFAALPEKISEGNWDIELDWLFPLTGEEVASIFDYFPADALIAANEADELLKALNKLTDERHSYFGDFLESGTVLPCYNDNYLPVEDVRDALLARLGLNFADFLVTGGLAMSSAVTLNAENLPSYLGRGSELAEDVAKWREDGYRVHFAASNDVRCGRVAEFLGEYGIFTEKVLEIAATEGFAANFAKCVLLTEKELLGSEKKAKSRRRKSVKKGRDIETFIDLNEGDYVVHLTHGIGCYMGVEQVKTSEFTRDYLLLQYAGGDKLYVPVEQMSLVQKYVGNDAAPPKIYKLGGNAWQKAKSRVKKSVADMTEELLRLYAARESLPGHAFSADGAFQREFEDAFGYVETPDQLTAAAEIKEDMEKARPMDRLLCGDVGYGKTEVAIRSAAKAVMDGKQVAVLVPTTILAGQHKRTFDERMKPFGINVGLLSRFVSAKQQKEVLRGVEEGKIDVLIGTHRILSKDIYFHDLGLLVIDEEQRFGVAHKEKLKGIKTGVDVLTLSATPIPRTLHMSLVGMRDMSVINTPPEDRYPVQTFVMEFDSRIVADAIKRELARQGQVYFVHNRVEDIEQVAAILRQLVPEARLGIAHGQMRETQLEPIMESFIQGEIDVLVCTTIAESGLDIANVNTLIVNNADCFGLNQLYQLRGRVGRTNRQAYAYFTYKAGKLLSDVAKSRLKAINDFTSLGSGFKIAMRDMEIRGAGNILGGEQHGHIEAIGFDLYCQLVQQAIEEGISGKSNDLSVDEPAANLDLGINAYIPDSYISDMTVKIEVYRRIGEIGGGADIETVRSELRDRFGSLPGAVVNLLYLGAFKAITRRLGIAAIIADARGYLISLREDHRLSERAILELPKLYFNKLFYKKGRKLVIDFRVPKAEKDKEGLPSLLLLLTEMENLSADDETYLEKKV